MLLPSALSCELPQISPSCQKSVLPSPQLSQQDDIASPRPVISNIYNTCCALQRMLVPLRTPSIPLRGMMTSSSQDFHSSKIRTRKRIGVPADRSRECLMKRRKYITRATMTRSISKQTRNIIDEEIPFDVRGVGLESENSASEDNSLHNNENDHCPKTPKRRFYVPDILPFGLQHTDFLDLKRHEMSYLCQDNQAPLDNIEINKDWSSDEDSLLVQLLCQKLRLTRSDWYDSAYRYRRDRPSLDKRW